MTHKCFCATYFGFCDVQQSLCVIHAPQREWADVRSSANASALMAQNYRDIAVAFRDAHTNENVCDHKNIKTSERLQEVTA
uniref:Uncharacterized protein n=1 Tax=Candidatus Methanogaster sp. ANME-2c ERB4 TaxID=2759911 RepID=A0A7G9Y9M4_9EURY|nr:hypothetical protein HMEJMANM_00025 [Methanosarcinales archaeon ANME-2c ERB4]QNO43619.1 hypothetical protein LAPIAFBC_00026 [Methanosarcinales archaeon ANME-2c ERB4]QNO44708.1 hypothetical protein LCOPCFJD_00007 [Methanosarcinales archaeon ANME-2c ERB4]